MSLTNPNNLVTEKRLSEFYKKIYPYLGARIPPSVYGMRILRDESVPSSKVIYLEDAIDMTPVSMNLSTGAFDYGSWGNAFFMPKPCMLKYDGTVDYYLDPNDYTKKADGTASDVADTEYEGNAMMEWPKIWLKIVPDESKNNQEADIFIANQQVDDDYYDWAYHNSLSESKEHFYTAIYNPSLVDNKYRSISGLSCVHNLTFNQDISYANANNPSTDVIWSALDISAVQLINFLIVLISKSTNSQAVFGSGAVWSNMNAFNSGTKNDKGLFYGTSSNNDPVKIFGMENWYGYRCKRLLGDIIINGEIKRKLTYGPEDGTNITGYNTTGENYLSTGATVIDAGWQHGKYALFNQCGLTPAVAGGTATTYYCDYFKFTVSASVKPLRFGDGYDFGDASGIFCYHYGSGFGDYSAGIACGLMAHPI